MELVALYTQIKVNIMVNGYKAGKKEKECISIPIRIYSQVTGLTAKNMVKEHMFLTPQE